MPLDTGLEGSCVLITGGTRGIGKSMVESFLSQGANVCYCARNVTGTEFEGFHGAASGVRAVGTSVDVGSQEDLAAWVVKCGQTFGRIDTVIANASPMYMREEPEYWQKSFDIDVMGFVNLAKAAIPYLEKSANASILVTNSWLGREFFKAPPSSYGPFKAAQLQYVNELSHCYGPKGIRVNAVSPGPIMAKDGPWERYQAEMPEWVEEQRKKVALQRLGNPQDIANAAVFLASSLSSYISGTNLFVDGGVHIGTQF
ncbi:Isoepoxydon dehydrogenase [Pleurostoma richardsiae]|uniref:Isoepoxydon dehydrogenase n=1 Tax=Pleurostoma richardsiae TaxID=41990 RepID=A0AA38VB84_9PEZI|nr:Isoepoxydon dehydrogenase [Pleurostoma richardsiae]